MSLLEKMMKNRQHICLVTEKGLITGILTLEDIFEEMVGEIEDEYDFFQSYIRPFGEGFIVSSSAKIADVFQQLNLPVAEEDTASLTVNQWTEKILGRPIEKQDQIHHNSILLMPRKFRRQKLMEALIIKEK